MLLRRLLFGLGGVLMVQPVLAQDLAMDTPTSIAGFETVCTGVGLDARQDPRWTAYGLKVEIAGEGGKYLGSETLTLRKAGKVLLEVGCSGPWLLFRLPPGRYDVEARIGGQTASSAAFVPANGQGRIILRFSDPESGGVIPPIKAPLTIAARPDIPDLAAGDRLAHNLCINCHVVDTRSPVLRTDRVPSFSWIANQEGETATSITVWLNVSHERMPNYTLTDDEIRQVSTYIMSLRKR